MILAIILILGITSAITATWFVIRLTKKSEEIKRGDGFEPENEAEAEAIKRQEGVNTIVNPWLVRERNISLENVVEIKNLHRIRVETFKKMEKTKSRPKLRALANEVEEIEYELQDSWGFPRDKSFHRWFEVPRCTCPKMDNADNIGVPDYNIIMGDCPIHSNLIKK